MNFKKVLTPGAPSYKILISISAILLASAIGGILVLAGSLNPTDIPTAGNETTWPHYPSLEDIYCKLNGAGCDASASYTLETSANPVPPGTMHTLNEIWSATPDFKTNPGNLTVNGSNSPDIFSGKTAYIYYNNSPTLLTGTTALNLACDTATFDGIANKVDNDHDNDPANAGRWCMKETGTIALVGTTSPDVANGKKVWVGGKEITGTKMVCSAGCDICQKCSGTICTAATTGWGAGTLGCNGANQRCYAGSCVTCDGYLLPDNCSGCAGQGSNACWHYNGTTDNCNSICTGHGGAVDANWNDDTNCNNCFYIGAQLGHSKTTCYLRTYADCPFQQDIGTSWICFYRDASIPHDNTLGGTKGGITVRRICVCAY